MLSEDKIRLMIALSDYEKGQGKTDLHRVGYYKIDYIRVRVIRTILFVTLALVFLFLLIAMYRMEYLVANLLRFDYMSIGWYLVVIYVLTLILFSTITVIIESAHYDESMKRTRVYYRTLQQLKDYYEEEETS